MNPKEIKKMLGQIDALKYDASCLEGKFLRAMGWENKTSDIDCCWYYFKIIKGKVVATNRETALKWSTREFAEKNPDLYREEN